MGDEPGEITVLLRRWKEGDPVACRELTPLVYPHLRELACAYLFQEGEDHTLQPTALVNELYLRLLRQRKADWKDRAHFYTFAAKMMRMILMDHARHAGADKRAGNRRHVPLSPEIPWVNVDSDEVIELNRALDELEAVDARKVQVVELRYFLGCTIEESADVLGMSTATVERDLNLVKSWLYCRLTGDPAPQSAADGK